MNSNADEGLFSQTFNRKAQKLQLYNLNEPIQLTHKSEPIEDHYEDDVSDHSEDDFRYSGDIRNLPQALEEHKQRREIERQVKESQRHLLSKLDSEFEHLDLAKFMRPKRGLVFSMFRHLILRLGLWNTPSRSRQPQTRINLISTMRICAV